MHSRDILHRVTRLRRDSFLLVGGRRLNGGSNSNRKE